MESESETAGHRHPQGGSRVVTGLHREEAESDAFWNFLCWSGASTVRDLFLKWFHLGGGGACL